MWPRETFYPASLTQFWVRADVANNSPASGISYIVCASSLARTTWSKREVLAVQVKCSFILQRTSGGSFELSQQGMNPLTILFEPPKQQHHVVSNNTLQVTISYTKLAQVILRESQ